MRILLLSAYDASSHRLWRQRLAALFPEHQWRQLALPPRHFDWRIRSNSLHWGLAENPQLDEPADLLIATSMVDLAALRGLRPSLARLPTLLYFHENQFFYPRNGEHRTRQRDNIEPRLVPIYSALCADAVVFNSEFNRRTFLEGCRQLFDRLPEQLPESAWQQLQAATVIPVPVATDLPQCAPRPADAHLEVIWNHRWEYDKGPELLLALCRQLLTQKLPLRLHICGQQFRRQPAQFREIETLCRQLTEASSLPAGQFGYLEQPDYEQLLARGDVVLSTAWHEFQGLGIQEACVAGCTPLAPRDLAYPEYLPGECLYERGEDEQQTAGAIVARLRQWLEQKNQGQALPRPELAAYCGPSIRTQYQQCFTGLVGGN